MYFIVLAVLTKYCQLTSQPLHKTQHNNYIESIWHFESWCSHSLSLRSRRQGTFIQTILFVIWFCFRQSAQNITTPSWSSSTWNQVNSVLLARSNLLSRCFVFLGAGWLSFASLLSIEAMLEDPWKWLVMAAWFPLVAMTILHPCKVCAFLWIISKPGGLPSFGYSSRNAACSHRQKHVFRQFI